jgi:chloramphenicol-sensitive protein RarD
MTSKAGSSDSRLGLSAGIGCYVIWGLIPLVFQLLGRLGASPWEILAHRTLWGAPAALILVLAARQGRQALELLRQPKTLAWLGFSAALIAVNWSTFIWAVNAGRVLETSLGYYIVPLFNMAAGAVLFRERLDRAGILAIALAAAGVVLQALALGHVPLVSLLLAVSFGGYGVVRKRVAAEAQTGLLAECLLLAVPGLAYVLWLQGSGSGHFQDPVTAAWLIACGPITAVPLALFAWAARRIPLSAMGFLQFITPTMTFVLGLRQGEPFTPLRAVSFALIWAGVAVFAWAAWRGSRPELKVCAETAPAE